MRSYLLAAVCLVCMFSETCISAEQGHQNTLNPGSAMIAKDYPQIVLYSVTWCPNCQEAKRYFTKYNIPFINNDVEMNANMMGQLTEKYNSNYVPMIVIGAGKGEVVVKGFTSELFQEALNKVKTKN